MAVIVLRAAARTFINYNDGAFGKKSWPDPAGGPFFLAPVGYRRGFVMFANFLQLLVGRPVPDHEQGFVEAVTIVRHETTPLRDPRVERLILGCWVLIAVKHVAIIWAVRHYPVPFHQLWINFPTWLLGALATGVYYARRRR